MSSIRTAVFARLTLIAATAFSALPAEAQQTHRLYQGAAPGSESWTLPDAFQATPGGGIYSNVRDPELIAYLPDPATANGTAVIHLPGGGLRLLAIEREAQDMIRRFNAEGIAVFVLKYRTLQTPREPSVPGPNTEPPPTAALLTIRNANANPAPKDAALSNVLRLAITDAQHALRMVRDNAEKWKVNPARVGLIGSSAGGGVAIGTVLQQAKGAVPDFVGTLYGPSLMDVTVPPNAPPLFMATESNHGPVTEGVLALFAVWKNAKKPVELHVFEVSNFSMSVSLWIDRCLEWMREQQLLAAKR